VITALLIYVIAERLLELVIARRNTQRLMAQGAVEVGASHYPVMVAMHTAWLVAVVAWVVFKNPQLNVPLLALYVVLQIFRLWVMVSLGAYWTTRIITVPNVPLVRTGPYKYLRHPNYVVVVLEIVLLPLVVDALSIAIIFSVANAAMLAVRIRAEEKTLKVREIS
jgi:methyltransferase